MNKFFQRLFLFEKYEMKTMLTKDQVKRYIDNNTSPSPRESDYFSVIEWDDIFISEHPVKYYLGGSSKNSFVPIFKGTVQDAERGSVVSGVIRMNIIVHAIVLPIYLLSLLTIVTFPIMYLFLHFSYFKHVKRMKEWLYETL